MLYKSVIVHSLTDEKATRLNILRSLNWCLGRGTPEDKIIFYFSGHTFSSHTAGEEPELLLFAHDTITDRLEQTAVNFEHVLHMLSAFPGKVMIFFDGFGDEASLSGAASRSLSTAEPLQEIVAFLSGGSSDFAYDGGPSHGVFTAAILRGLSGGADNGDGLITLGELSEYIAGDLARRLEETPILSTGSGWQEDDVIIDRFAQEPEE